MHRRENGRGQNVSRQLEDAKEAAHADGTGVDQRPQASRTPSARKQTGAEQLRSGRKMRECPVHAVVAEAGGA